MDTIEAQRIDFERDIVEFRPRPGLFRSNVRRYAEGKWIPDDGEYDVAFVCTDAKLGESAGGYGACLYFEPSFRKNIRWSWCDGHWSGKDPRHPKGNAWHYMLVPGTSEWGEWERHRHANELAKESGFGQMRESGCCNGVAIELKPDDPHIQLGLARIKGSGFVIVPPSKPVCMYCSDQKRLDGDLKQIKRMAKQFLKDSPDRSNAENELRALVDQVIEL